MEFEQYRELVKNLNLGKKLPNSIYVHEGAIAQLLEQLALLAIESADKFYLDDDSWNIFTFFRKDLKKASPC